MFTVTLPRASYAAVTSLSSSAVYACRDLQNLIFDNRALWNHRALAAVMGVVLHLPPIKQVMASQQVKSRYMEY